MSAGCLRIEELTICGMKTLVMRKEIRNLYLRVRPEDGALLVSAPVRATKRQIQGMIEGRMDWIGKQRERLAADGAGLRSVRLWGKEYPGVCDQELLLKWYREELLRELPRYTAKWEAITGLSAEDWSVRIMKTRWGSCTPKTRRIRLAAQLAAYPPECLEYVIVHELMHFYEANHGRRFWSLVERYCPDFREIRKLLREGNPSADAGELS